MAATNLTIEAANDILAAHFAPWVLASGVTTHAVGIDQVTLRIPFSAHLCRTGGIMSGQTLIAGADTAMVLAIAAAAGGFKPVATVDLTIKYMRPVAGADALLVAKVIRLGRSLAFCTAEIAEAGRDKPAAFATGTFAMPG